MEVYALYVCNVVCMYVERFLLLACRAADCGLDESAFMRRWRATSLERNGPMAWPQTVLATVMVEFKAKENVKPYYIV
jgi:hypothetical protein